MCQFITTDLFSAIIIFHGPNTFTLYDTSVFIIVSCPVKEWKQNRKISLLKQLLNFQSDENPLLIRAVDYTSYAIL